VSSQPSTAALFPGQGCSLHGVEAQVKRSCPDLYELCLKLLGVDPFERAGDSTRYAQPAIFLASIASWRELFASGLRPSAFAGHSLGELSALTAAGVFAEPDGLRLVVLRGSLMASADASGGRMLALLKGDIDQARVLAERFGVTVANDNSPGQAVLSGSDGALAGAAAAAHESGLRAVQLNVKGAFHSPAMRAAVEPFRRAVEGVELGAPLASVFSGLTTEPFENVAAELSQALCAAVRWRETTVGLARLGVECFLDVGPDAVLAGLSRRNVPERTVVSAEELGVAA
jgi:malonyl CoA-acyl carrier protein transacylase